MSRLTSQHFVDRTSELLREQCGGEISLSMVLEACGAQKGSLYHFFPGGKEELFVAAVEKMRGCVLAHLGKCMQESQSAADGIKKHLQFVAKLIDRPNSELGMPFLALGATIGESCKSVQIACEEALKDIESCLSKQLVVDGFSSREAKRLAAFAVAAIEGAILLARLRSNSAPVRLAADTIAALVSR